jgi:hypothetical protein
MVLLHQSQTESESQHRPAEWTQNTNRPLAAVVPFPQWPAVLVVELGVVSSVWVNHSETKWVQMSAKMSVIKLDACLVTQWVVSMDESMATPLDFE